MTYEFCNIWAIIRTIWLEKSKYDIPALYSGGKLNCTHFIIISGTVVDTASKKRLIFFIPFPVEATCQSKQKSKENWIQYCVFKTTSLDCLQKIPRKFNANMKWKIPFTCWRLTMIVTVLSDFEQQLCIYIYICTKTIPLGFFSLWSGSLLGEGDPEPPLCSRWNRATGLSRWRHPDPQYNLEY